MDARDIATGNLVGRYLRVDAACQFHDPRYLYWRAWPVRQRDQARDAIYYGLDGDWDLQL